MARRFSLSGSNLAFVGMVIAASALRFRGSTTPPVGVARDEPISHCSAEHTAHDGEAGVDGRGRERRRHLLTHPSTCERRIERSGMSPNVTPAMARSAFSRVDDNHTCLGDQSA